MSQILEKAENERLRVHVEVSGLKSLSLKKERKVVMMITERYR